MKNFLGLFILILSFACGIDAQTPGCKIGDVNFACPSEYFKQVKSADPRTRIFKYSGEANQMYFFMSVPSGPFDAAHIGELVLANYPNSKGEKFSWKRNDDPMVMNTKTKYKFDLLASVGLTDSFLFEVKSFGFSIGKKNFVLGYVSDISEDPTTNRRVFSTLDGFGDNAPGCNAVVTALNSVTKEFKGKKQYCFLTGFTAQ